MKKNLNENIRKIRDDMDKKADKKMNIILREYKKSLKNIQNEMSKIYMEYSDDRELKVNKKQRYSILMQLDKKLIEELKNLGAVDVKETTIILEEVYSESYYRTAFEIDRGLNVILDFPILKKEFIKSAINLPIKGKMFSDRIWDNKNKLVNKVRKSVKSAVIEGVPIDKLAREIKKEFGTSAYESKRLIYNEVARCVSQAQDEIYENNDAVVEVMFDATLDDKTSDICQSLDGTRYSKGSQPSIPEDTHVGCRSCIIPVVENWNPSRKRENMKGDDGEKYIINYKDYRSWIESRGIHILNEQ